MNKIIQTTILAIALAFLPMASHAETKTLQTGNKGKEVKNKKPSRPIDKNIGPSRDTEYRGILEIYE